MRIPTRFRLVIILTICGFQPAAAQLVVINTDTTINDNTFTTGVDVVAGAGGATTTVGIDAPAMVGSTVISTLPISVRANDDSEIEASGGTLTGIIQLLDSSMLRVTGNPSIEGGSTRAVSARDDSRIDYSGGTVSWGTDMQDTARLVMDGGMGTQRDFIDTFDDNDDGSVVIELSNVDITGRDLLDLGGADRATLTNVHARQDAVDTFDGPAEVTWIGGTIKHEDGLVTSFVDAFDLDLSMSNTSTLLADAVDITGRDALDAFGGSIATLRNLMITGEDAVDAFNSSRVTLQNLQIIGSDALDVFDSAVVRADDIAITGNDPIDVFSQAQLFLRNVTIDGPADELEVSSDATATIFGRNFVVNGTPFPGGSIPDTIGTITGTNSNGSPIDITFERFNNGRIILVVEGSAAAPTLHGGLLALLALFLVGLGARRVARHG